MIMCWCTPARTTITSLMRFFFKDLGVRQPDHFLGVDTSSLGATVGGILVGSEKVLKSEKPDAVLILGDTNSAISAYIARRLKIPVYHMEAGNRCFDRMCLRKLTARWSIIF